MTCSAPDCGRQLYAKGMCSLHYQRGLKERRWNGEIPTRETNAPQEWAASYTREAYLADVEWHAQRENRPMRAEHIPREPSPALQALATRLERRLAQEHQAGASDEQKLDALRDLARQSGAHPDRPWPDDSVAPARESRRLTDSQLRDVAWTAPNGAERGWTC